jgi:hypothetical protein
VSRELAVCIVLAGPFLVLVMAWLDLAIPMLEACGL